MGVQAIKHAAMLQEWSTKIAECRSSGMSVKDWCAEQGITIKTYYYGVLKTTGSDKPNDFNTLRRLFSLVNYRTLY